MGVVIKHTKEDIKRFKAEKCSTCHCLDSCHELFENFDEHIQYCPKFFNFMIGFKSFVEEQLEWQRAHPEEVEARRQANLELSKKIRAQRKASKKSKDI